MTLKEFLAVFTVNDPVAGRALNTTTNGGVDSLGDLLTLSDPSGGRAIKIAISGGVTKFWTEAYNAGTQATSSWTATGAATNINATIVPKGTGAITAQIPTGTIAGGNARGTYANDFQRQRNAASQVASGDFSVITGGDGNSAYGNRSFVGAGFGNGSGGWYTFVGAGYGNSATGNDAAAVVGGLFNSAQSLSIFVGGGHSNTVSNQYASIVGGSNNQASGSYSFIGGGGDVGNAAYRNTASGNWGTVGGGTRNVASGTYSAVVGGYINQATAYTSFIGGGEQNYISSVSTGGNAICGGRNNSLAGTDNTADRFIGGGTRNTINADQTVGAAICAGIGNTIYFGSAGGFIGGGGYGAYPGGNFLCGSNSTLVGGQNNYVGDGAGNGYAAYNFLGGGGGNDIKRECDYSVITGGQNNTINQAVDYGIITGGYQGVVSLYGQQAHASGRFAANGDAQAHELVWRRAITGTAQTELFLDGASVAAVLPGTNSIWQGTVDIAAVCTTTGDGTTIVGHVAATSYKVTIKRIGTTTSLVGAVQEIGTTNADGSMATAAITIDNNDTNESLRIRFTPPGTAGSTTVIRVVATFRGLQIQY